MYQNSENMSSPENLDELIRRASEVRVEEERIDRLERFWRERSASAAWRRRIVRLGGLAAAALVAFVLLTISNHRRVERGASQEVSVMDEPALEAAVATAVEPRAPARAPDEARSSSVGRAPTAYERFIFVARTQMRLPTAKPAVDVAMDELIARAKSAPNIAAEEVFGVVGVAGGEAEAALLKKLPRSGREDQRAIVRLLGVCGTRRSVPVLLQMGQREAMRGEVLAAVEGIVGLDALAEVAESTADESTRRALVHRLLTADSESALRAYLSLVAGEATRGVALAVAERLPDPPIARFLALVDDDARDVRLSAAIVLSTLNGPVVTRSLIGRVTARPGDSTEAWIALVGCRGELAEEFFAYAMQRPRLLGYFNGARLRWSQMTP